MQKNKLWLLLGSLAIISVIAVGCGSTTGGQNGMSPSQQDPNVKPGDKQGDTTNPGSSTSPGTNGGSTTPTTPSGTDSNPSGPSTPTTPTTPGGGH